MENAHEDKRIDFKIPIYYAGNSGKARISIEIDNGRTYENIHKSVDSMMSHHEILLTARSHLLNDLLDQSKIVYIIKSDKLGILTDDGEINYGPPHEWYQSRYGKWYNDKHINIFEFIYSYKLKPTKMKATDPYDICVCCYNVIDYTNFNECIYCDENRDDLDKCQNCTQPDN